MCGQKETRIMKGNKDIFLKEYFRRFPDSVLDFEKSLYVNSKTKMTVTDPDYGDFEITPSNLLAGREHPERGKTRISESKRMKWEDLVKKMKAAHKGENIEYPEQEYVNMHTKIRIIDHDLRPDGTEFGEYWQTPANHIKSCGHPDKGAIRQGLKKRLTNDDFIEKANLIHNGKYGYEDAYVSYRTPMTMICPIHGEFSQTPECHLANKGCPKCAATYSKAEDEIFDMIREWLPGIEVIKNDRSVLDGKEIDIYIPERHIGIEYDGLQWHTESCGKDRNYHIEKTMKCLDKGIRLYHIFEDEYRNRKEQVIDKLKTILNVNIDRVKISARESTVKEISKGEAKVFLDRFHIQGFAPASVYMGAFYNGKLRAVMDFKKVGKDRAWDLNRFATDTKYICRGFAGKLFSAFLRRFRPEEVKSFADVRWTPNKDGNLYTTLGFKLESIERPDYSYYNHNKGVKRFHKFGFRKQTLIKRHGFPKEWTEHMMTERLGYDKIWNCGLYKYVWKN